MNATQNIANSARIYCAVASTGQALARAAGCGYTLRISKGIRVLQPGAIRGIKPQLPQPCGFFVGAPFFGGADGNPQGLSVFAPRVARSANLSALPPRFCSLVGSCFKSNLEPIMTNTLIPVFTGNLSNAPVQLCDARTLHAFMQVKRDFSNWIKGRIRKFGFEVGLDYLVAKSGEQLPSGTKHVIDYHLTLDMAKELSMVENNDMGKQARRYFIECEKAVTQQPLALPAPGLTKAQQQQLKAAVQASCGADGKAYSACYGALYAAFQVPRYQDIAPDQFDAAMAFVRGFNAKPALPAPAPLTTSLSAQVDAAMKAAAFVSSQVLQAVLYAVVHGSDDWKHQSWMVSFVTDSKFGAPVLCEPLPRGAIMLTAEELASGIEDSSYLLTNRQLAALNVASSKSLAKRLQYTTHDLQVTA